MNANNLVPGKAYHWNFDPREDDCPTPTFNYTFRDVATPLRYVRTEKLPRIGGTWETFYAIDGGRSCMRLAALPLKDVTLLRIRIPVEDVYAFNDTLFLGDIRRIASFMMIEETHTPIVTSWIEDVKRINKRILDEMTPEMERADLEKLTRVK
jgi:hypothetical protein